MATMRCRTASRDRVSRDGRIGVRGRRVKRDSRERSLHTAAAGTAARQEVGGRTAQKQLEELAPLAGVVELARAGEEQEGPRSHKPI